MPNNPKQRREKLFNILKERDLYDGDNINHFNNDFSSNSGQEELYGFLVDAGLTESSLEDFKVKFYSDINTPKKKEDGGGDSDIGLEEQLRQKMPSPNKEELATDIKNQLNTADNPTVNSEELPPVTLTVDDVSWEGIDLGIAPASLEADIKSAKNQKAIELDVIEKRFKAGNIKSQAEYEQLKKAVDKRHMESINKLNRKKSQFMDVNPEIQKEMEAAYITTDAMNKFLNPQDEKLKEVQDNVYSEVKGVIDQKSDLLESFDKKLAADLSRQGIDFNSLGERDKVAQRQANFANYIEDMKKEFPDVPERIWNLHSFYAQNIESSNGDTKNLRQNLADDFRRKIVLGVVNKQEELNDTEKSALSTYLLQRSKNQPKVDEINEQLPSALTAAGLKTPEQMITDFKSDISKAQEEIDLATAQSLGRLEAQGKLIDDEWRKKEEEWADRSQNEYTTVKNQFQKMVEDGQVDAKDANDELDKMREAFQQEYRDMYDLYTQKRSRLQRLSIADQDKIKKIKASTDQKLKELQEKHGIKVDEGGDVVFSEDYKQRYNAVVSSLFEQQQLKDKADKDRRWKELSLLGKFNVSFQSGMMNLFEAAGAGMKYFSPGSEAPDLFLDQVEDIREGLPRKDFGEFEVKKRLTDPDWYISVAGEQLPMMMPLMGLGGKGFQMANGFLGRNTALSLKSRMALSSMVGGGLSRFAESHMEAHLAMQNDLKGGKSYEDAMKTYDYVKNANYWLAISDAMQLYFTFNKMAKPLAARGSGRLPSILRNTMGFGGRAGIQMTLGGEEELYQEYAQAKANNPLLTYADFRESDAGREIWWTGAVMDFGADAFMGGLSDRSQISQLNDQIRSYFDSFSSKEIGLGDVENRLFQLQNSISALQERGVLSDDQVTESLEKMDHIKDMYTQTMNGELPFDWESQKFNDYSALAFEYRKLRTKASDMDRQGRNAEKELYTEQSQRIEKQMMDMVNDAESNSYSINGVPLQKEEFESLVFNDENQYAIPNFDLQTTDIELRKKMLDYGVNREKSISNAEAYLDNLSTPDYVATIDDGIAQAKEELAQAKQEVQANQANSQLAKKVILQKQKEQNLQDLEFYKQTLETKLDLEEGTFTGEAKKDETITTEPVVEEDQIITDQEVVESLEPTLDERNNQIAQRLKDSGVQYTVEDGKLMVQGEDLTDITDQELDNYLGTQQPPIAETAPIEGVETDVIEDTVVEQPVTEVTPPSTEKQTVPVEPPKQETTTTEPPVTPATEQPQVTIPKTEKTKEQDTPTGDMADMDRGYRVVGGVKYNRQQPIQNVAKGSETKVLYSYDNKNVVPAQWTVMEAEDLQPSHMKGQKNPMFFLGKAQPKDRSKGAKMKAADVLKAQDIKPWQLGDSPNAYFGAPNVNERGEVIQGNGRAAGIKEYYKSYNQGKEYETWLKDNADKFGIAPDQIGSFKQPVLVRMQTVQDTEGMRLGQFTPTDLEDLPDAAAIAKARLRRLDVTQVDKINTILQKSAVEDSTLRDAIRRGGRPLANAMRDAGALKQEDIDNGVKASGGLKPSLIDKIQGFFRQMMLEGNIADLNTSYEELPFEIYEGIERSIVDILGLSDRADILADLQNSIWGIDEFEEFKRANKFGNLKTASDRQAAFDSWLNAKYMFSDSPKDRYTPTEIGLIDFLANKSIDQVMDRKAKGEKRVSQRRQIQEAFNKYAELTKPTKGDFFTAASEGMDKTKALSEALNVTIRESKQEDGGISPETTTGQTEATGPAPTTTGVIPTSEKQPIDRYETELGEIDFKDNVNPQDAVSMFEAMVNEGNDPIVARDIVIQGLRDEAGVYGPYLSSATKAINAKIAEMGMKEAKSIENKVDRADDAKTIDAIAEANDEMLDNLPLPTELNEDLTRELLASKLIDNDMFDYVMDYLNGDKNDITQIMYDEAISKLPQLIDNAKTSKKAKAKRAKKKTSKRTKEKKAKSPLQAAEDELRNLLNQLSGDVDEQQAGGVPVYKVIQAGVRYSYEYLNDLARKADTTGVINKKMWKTKMLSTFGSVVEPYLDTMWDTKVPSSVDSTRPKLSDYAKVVKKGVESRLKPDAVKAVPTTKQSIPPKKKQKAGERPPIEYVNRESIPTDVLEYIDEGKYGTNLDENQRFASNLALDQFLTKKGRTFLLADNMGTGKTRQILAVANEYKQRTNKPVLIVSQNKTILNTSFADDAKAMGINMNDFDVTTYSSLPKFEANDYGLIVYDESHNLKNPNKAFESASRMNSNHVMYSTATPADKIGAAVYYLSDLVGVSKETMMGELGVTIGDKGWEMRPGKSSMDAVKLIDKYTQEAIKDGKMIRREYPYWGKVIETTLPINEQEKTSFENVTSAYDAQIDKVKPGNWTNPATGKVEYSPGRRKWDKRYKGLTNEQMDQMDDKIQRELREQKINQLDKLAETYKADMAIKMVKQDLAKGRSVIIASKYVNDVNVKALDGNYGSTVAVPSFLQQMRSLLQKEGIEFVEITGSKDKELAVERFQNNEVQVVLGSLDSMSTGINLDDTTGSAPRTLYVATPSYDANKFAQIQGRASRRNTKTPTETQILYKNTPSETTKKRKVTKKTGLLAVTQGYGITEDYQSSLQEQQDLFEGKAKERKQPELEDISPRAFVVKNAYPMRVLLKDLGGRWNRKTKGWMFPNSRKEEIQNVVDKYNDRNEGSIVANQALDNYKFYAMSGTQANIDAIDPDADTRIAISPIVTDDFKTEREVLGDLRKRFKAVIRYGRPSSPIALGAYKTTNSLISIKEKNDVDTIIHELGHLLDDRFQLADSSLDSELSKFWIYGSTPSPNNPDPLSYIRAEGIAEFIRAYIVNPDKAKEAAPNTYARIEAKLTPDALANLNMTSKDVRSLAGLDVYNRVKATTERMKQDEIAGKGLRGRLNLWAEDQLDRFKFKDENQNFYINWWDKNMMANWSDKLAPWKKSMRYLYELHGLKEVDILPEDNPYTLARLFAGIGSKINNFLSKGLPFVKENGMYGRKIDPVSKSEISVDWLITPIATEVNKTRFKDYKFRNVEVRDIKDFIGSYMVAQRTLELGERFNRENKLTGIGMGLFSDTETAKKFLEKFETEQEGFKDMVKEGARRYRLFADTVLEYMRDNGVITQESIDFIKNRNQQYVALQRVMESKPGEDFSIVEKNKSGQMVLPAIRGSAATRWDPYANLMETTYKSIEQADRNRVLNTFIDYLRSDRQMYEDTPQQLADIGFRRTDIDSTKGGKLPSNVVQVYNDGVKEYWELQEDVFKSVDAWLYASKMNPGLEPVIKFLGMPGKLIRFGVTKNPIFAYARNMPRDYQSRLIQSRTYGAYQKALLDLGANPDVVKDLKKEIKENLSQAGDVFDLYGADQAGYYTKSKEHYYAALDQSMRKLARDGQIVLSPDMISDAWQGYNKFLSYGERVNRVAEYKTAFKYAKAKLSYDDYNAHLYAAFQARDLMDFAVMGHTMEYLNKIIPFSNASLQGTKRMLKSMYENPVGFTTKFALISVLPSMAMWMLSKLGDYEDEYKDQMPYLRDMYFGFKIPGLSDKWMYIPKPFEIGVLSSGIERAISGAVDKDEFSMDGYFGWNGSLATSMLPIGMADMQGGWKTLWELRSNYSDFYKNEIIPHYEKKLPVELRKGKTKGSRLGQIGYRVTGFDPRNVDYLVKSWFTYFGNYAIKLSNIGREDAPPSSQFSIADLGLFKQSKLGRSQSVQRLFELSNKFDLSETPDMKSLRTAIDAYAELEDPKMRDRKFQEVIKKTRAIRSKWEKNVKIYQDYLAGREAKTRGIKLVNKAQAKSLLFNN